MRVFDDPAEPGKVERRRKVSGEVNEKGEVLLTGRTGSRYCNGEFVGILECSLLFGKFLLQRFCRAEKRNTINLYPMELFKARSYLICRVLGTLDGNIDALMYGE